ncbi:hypothetical protein [Pseudomonas sp. 14P_8.1_Bac3]|uniref:hypothetical protein n=1 Tax=Pseudomonas sp. 14P_8.1_Bac3 TaxID=2971621 RepID=UPI0021C62717|nr:hypothetical protein [Pseudomonas sp. 14P_8.1_Bac3]
MSAPGYAVRKDKLGFRCVENESGVSDNEVFSKEPPDFATVQTKGEVQARRRAAYSLESDPIKNEADYDAQAAGLEPDYAEWILAVSAIKARYPLPA